MYLGTCERGDSCRFEHTGAPGSNPNNDDAIAAAKANSVRYCSRFQKANGCKFGDECKFAHVIKEKKPVAEKSAVPKSKKPVGVCFAWQKGECERGDTCKFNHFETATTESTVEVAEDVKQKKKRNRKSKKSKKSKADPDAVQTCREFDKSGECKYGDDCKYAHIAK